jgi:hypothetical protein
LKGSEADKNGDDTSASELLGFVSERAQRLPNETQTATQQHSNSIGDFLVQ